MAAETPDRIDIGRLQSLLGKDTDSLPVTQVLSSPPRSAENLVPRTPARHSYTHSHSPHTPATYLHTNPHSHDRTGSLQLAYSNSISYSQIDLGETQVDNGTEYEFTQHGEAEGDTTIMTENQHGDDLEIVCNTPEIATIPIDPPLEDTLILEETLILEDTLILDPTPEDDLADESAPAYFPEARRFSSPHVVSSPIKKPAGHNPLSHMSFTNAAVRRMPISLTQMFDAVSSPLRPAAAAGVFSGGTSLPPTPSAAEATKLLARTLSRMESDLIPPVSSPVPESKATTTEEEEDLEAQGSPTQVDPVTVYVSMQQSQEAREKNLRKKLGPRRKTISSSISPVVFNSSFVQKPQKPQKQRKQLDSSAGSDDGMISSGEERRRRANAARRKGDDEAKRLFSTVKASREREGLWKSQNIDRRGKERAKSEEMVKKRVPKKPIGTLRRRQTKSASPPTPTSAEETGDEEDIVVERTPEVLRVNSGDSAAPTASNESIPPTAEDEDDVVLPMDKTHTNPSEPIPPVIFTSDAPPSPSCEKTQVIDSNGPSSALQTQYTQLLPHDWESLHNPIATFLRRTRPAEKPSIPTSSIADSQPIPSLTHQKTSLRSLPPFNIPSPSTKRPIPEFVQETSGLVPMSDPISSLTPLPSDASSPVPMGKDLQTPFVARGTALVRMRNGATTIPETSPRERGGVFVPAARSGEGGAESPTRKRKRHSGGKAQKQTEGEVVPCSVEETEKRLMGFADIDGGRGFLSSRPEPDDVDMVGIVADVGAGRDGLVEVTPRAEQGRRAGRGSAKRIRMTPKAGVVDGLQEVEPVAAPEEEEPVVAKEVPEAPEVLEQARSALAKTAKGKQAFIPKSSRTSIGKAGKAKSKALVRKTRSSTGLRNSIGSIAPDTPTPMADTDDDADILTSNNPAFSLSVLAPPGPVDVSITVPERVFALFRDGKHSFHPATVLESDVYTGVVKVVFDDGTEDVIERSSVRCLDLRVGDGVKVDLAGMKKAVWEVVGLKQGEVDGKLSDCRGHMVVSVKARKTAGAVDGEVVDVRVTNIYLVKSMWKDFNSRVYKDPPGTLRGVRGATPSESFSVHSAPTTPSKGLRNTPMAASFSTSFARPGVGLFAGMVFALSFGDKESVKKVVMYKILQNGGKIVDSGFEELFYDIDRSSGPTSNSFSSDSSRENTASPVQFTPRPETERVGFTAVIADTHSRRAKFLQALALGLPCLAAKWVEDCCRKGKVVEWEHYLLPAGESKYLGTVKSRMLEGYDARSARLAGVVGGRRRLLEGRGVVVVVGMGKGVKTCEKRKPYLFLTYALGASRVAKAVTLEGANKVLQRAESEGELEEKWDFVYVEAKDKDRAERMWGGKGKKSRVKVVDDEWVIQSLILGRLIDDD